MKAARHVRIRPDHGDAVTRQRCHATPPALGTAFGVRLEAHDLLRRVNPGVGPPRRDDSDRFVGYLREGSLQFRLNGSRIGLALETVKARSVVLDAERDGQASIFASNASASERSLSVPRV